MRAGQGNDMTSTAGLPRNDTFLDMHFIHGIVISGITSIMAYHITSEYEHASADASTHCHKAACIGSLLHSVCLDLLAIYRLIIPYNFNK